MLSDVSFYEKNFKLLKQTLIRNKYPNGLIDSVVDETIEKWNQYSGPTEKPKIDWNKICVIPYVKGLFECIKKTLKKEEIVAVAKGFKSLGDTLFSRLKDKTPPLLQSNLVYEASCGCGANYIGQTTCRLEKRLYNHKYNASIGCIEHSALCKHLVETGHSPELIQAKILRTERVKEKLDIIEMIEIKRSPGCINKQTDSMFLSNAYFSILGIV